VWSLLGIPGQYLARFDSFASRCDLFSSNENSAFAVHHSVPIDSDEVAIGSNNWRTTLVSTHNAPSPHAHGGSNL
jgi:hypothetical protein